MRLSTFSALHRNREQAGRAGSRMSPAATTCTSWAVDGAVHTITITKTFTRLQVRSPKRIITAKGPTRWSRSTKGHPWHQRLNVLLAPLSRGPRAHPCCILHRLAPQSLSGRPAWSLGSPGTSGTPQLALCCSWTLLGPDPVILVNLYRVHRLIS
jgi:hypothetical protein